MRILEFPRFMQQPGPKFLRPFHQPFLFEHAKGSACHGTSQRIATVSAAVAAGTEHAQYLVTRYHGRYRVGSTGESFAQDQHIRLHILCVAGKEMPSAAQTGLNFVRYEQHAFAAANRRGVADETVGRNQDASFALDWLEQKRARVRGDGSRQCLRVTERNRDEARCERSEAILV